MLAEQWPLIVGVILAGLGLAFISLIEAAMVSISHVRLRQLIEGGHPTAPIVEQLTSRSQELLGGLVIGINVFVLLAANLTTAIVIRANLGEDALVWLNLLVLAALLVFSEITPKTLSVNFAERIALRTARVARFITIVLSPLVVIFHTISVLILRLLVTVRLLPGRVRAERTYFTEEDIKQLVTAGEQSGEVEATEREMIHGVIEFSETAAHEIMVPRTDLVALASDASLEEAVETFISSGHSRLPVYEDDLDHIMGLLYIKDVLIRLHAAEETDHRAPTVRELIRPAYFVPESKKSDELLRELQRKQVHLAVVVDEYGGTAGIITIEDLLEEIVGDIIDEYDQERLEVAVLPDGTTLVSGRTSPEKVEETFDIVLPESEAETISGLVTDILGHIPEVGEQVVLNGFVFTVTEVAQNRAERLQVVQLPETQAGE